jgi:hypothetical protein
MPTQRYALERGGPERLEIAWRGMWKEVTVHFDDQEVGVIPNRRALSAGQSFTLPDGSTLHVQLVSKVSTTELQVFRDGQPLPGSASDPHQRLRMAYGMVFFIAALNVILGLIATLGPAAFLRSLGIGVLSIVFGLIFAVLGAFVMRMSAVALIAAIVLFALDGILGFVLVASADIAPNIGGVVARAFFLVPMVQGVRAIAVLKERAGP